MRANSRFRVSFHGLGLKYAATCFIALLQLLAPLLLLGSCGIATKSKQLEPSPEPAQPRTRARLVVRVSGWPDNGQQLRVLPTFGGKPLPTIVFSAETREFYVEIPGEQQGLALLEGRVADDAGCYVAGHLERAPFSGRTDVELDEQHIELALVPYAQKQCPRPCSADGFCRENPTLLAESLRRIWGDRPDNIWIAGERGAVLRWDGATWNFVPTSTLKDLLALFGSGGEVWSAGYFNQALAWNGSAWMERPAVPGGSVHDLWSSSPHDVWALRDSYSSPVHWNGAYWEVGNDIPRAVLFTALWGASASDVWTVGLGGGLAHFDGSAWRELDAGKGPRKQDWYGVWGSGPNDVWMFGEGPMQHWDGSSFQSFAIDTTSRISAAWGTSAANVWAVGQQGTILHFDGHDWRSVPSGTARDLNAVWGSSAYDVWAVGEGGTILRRNGARWSVFHEALKPHFNAVWASSPQDVWAVGEGGITLHYDGTKWSAIPSTTTQTLNAVWGSSANNVWAVGEDGTVRRWNGNVWIPIPSGTTNKLSAVWSTGPSDVWAIGQPATILRWDGSAFSLLPSPTGASLFLYSVWGSGPGDAWIVGDLGSIVHWNGTALSLVTSNTRDPLQAVWGSSASDVWAVGRGFGAVHWNGSVWSTVPLDVSASFKSVWGFGASDVFAAGNYGQIHHYDGSRWTRIDAGTIDDIAGLRGAGSDLWAVGSNGMLMHRRAP